ncbi:MAG TPA: penicillin-binding transpeptidase domain-containing protein [Acidimicrobiales bacterium]|nr:penicillin-binding transpeptidase domain-containing protein [Acidimicrobiales bacterium]
MPHRRLIAAVAACAVVGIAAVLAVVLTRSSPTGPRPAATAYLAAWTRGDVNAMVALVDQAPPGLAATYQQEGRDVHQLSARYSLSEVHASGASARATFAAHVDVGGLGPWDYQGALDLRRVSGRWLVAWSPASIHPSLGVGQRLRRVRTWGPRAPIVGALGAPLADNGTSVSVGIEPSRMKDQTALLAALQRILGIDPAPLATALGAPGLHADAFVPVTDLSEDRYNQLRPALFPLPGTVFQRHLSRVASTADLAAHVIGRVGPVTAELLTKLGPPYEANDQVGLSGLEASAERALAGTPSGEIDVVDAGGTVVSVLQHFAGSAGRAVQTTLDIGVQRAAEAALNGVSQPAALVAIRPSTGEVEAVVSRPTAVAFDRALEGRYAPGSTFKVVTATALLELGLSPNASVTCPPDVIVGGKKFTNFEGEAAATLTFARAFALSCNTAFVSLASRLTPPQLVATAAQFGFGTDPRLGVPAIGGRSPLPSGSLEQAAAAIGQGSVDASPLAMAEVAAAAESGQWRAPSLVVGAPAGSTSTAPTSTTPTSTATTVSTTATPPATSAPLAADVLAALHQLMAGVVTSGTGTAAAVPGGPPVFGKTGTAEFGTATPPATHAWFIGFRGDLAFAVLVEGGGIGGQVAAPLAAKFLAALPATP